MLTVPGGDRRGDAVPAPGRPGRGLRLPRASCSSERTWLVPRPAARRDARWREPPRPSRRPGADDRGRRRHRSTRPRRRRWTRSPGASGSRSPRPRRARARCPGTTRSSWGPSARPAGSAGQPRRARRRPGHRHRHPAVATSRPHHWTAWQDPDVRFVAINVPELDARKGGALPIVADARAALDELTALARRARLRGDRCRPPRASTERLRADWNAEVDRVCALATPQHVSQPAGDPAGQRGRRPATASWCAPPAACRATCTSCGGRRGRAATTWSTATRRMGYEVAGGMGVAIADPDRRVT